ncbi:MAG: PHP domain-containing protein [Firmicutes bacterium]|nr:PHP domain-containing protein [Bacillota bacterium]
MNDGDRADLHVHTTASDGTYTPSRAVLAAKRAGLAAVAITDHDTAGGVAEALRAGLEAGIEVIPGLEINTDFGSTEIHVLGYLAWPLPERLSGLLARMREAREGRVDEMVRRLSRAGVKISASRVREIAAGGVVGRPHVARAMVEAGSVRSVPEAFELYLNVGRPCYVERYKITPHDAVRELVVAGAVTVLAHPGSARRDDVIPELVGAGLRGIEVYHPDHDHAAVARYLEIASEYSLLVTGGSDSHGEDEYGSTIGRVTVPHVAVTRMKAIRAEMEYGPSAPDIIATGRTKPGGDQGEVHRAHGRRPGAGDTAP